MGKSTPFRLEILFLFSVEMVGRAFPLENYGVKSSRHHFVVSVAVILISSYTHSSAHNHGSEEDQVYNIAHFSHLC